MNSPLFKVDSGDFAKGIALAVIAAILTWLLQLVDAPGFSVYQIDWNEVFRIAFAAGVSYILKNYLSDSQGRVLGQIGK